MQVLPSTILAHLAGFLDPKSVTVLSTASKDQCRVLNGQFAQGVCMFCNVRLEEPGECPKFPWCGIPDDEQEALKAYVRGDDYPMPDITDPSWEWDEMYNELQSRRCALEGRHWGNEYVRLYRGHVHAGRPTPDFGDWVTVREVEKSAKAVDLKWKEFEDMTRLPREAGWLMTGFFDWAAHMHSASSREQARTSLYQAIEITSD
jgi:hypothetical protein